MSFYYPLDLEERILSWPRYLATVRRESHQSTRDKIVLKLLHRLETRVSCYLRLDSFKIEKLSELLLTREPGGVKINLSIRKQRQIIVSK